MSIDIFSLLQSYSTHNPHFLSRYYNLVTAWCKVNSSKSKEEIGYTENHHILPKSMFPEYKSFSKYPENKAPLTFRQHIMAHVMLWKAYHGNHKLLYALNRMLNRYKDSRVIPTSIHIRLLEKFRIDFSVVMSGKNHPMYGKTHSEESRAKISAASSGERNNMYGKTHSEESRAKISAANKGKLIGKNHPMFGKTHSKEARALISSSRVGRIASEETREKMSASMRGVKKSIVTCPNCGKSGGGGAMKQWHFDNCKNKGFL